MRLYIIILTLLAGITLVTSSASAKAQDRKFESRGQTEEGYPRIEVGKGLGVNTVVRAFSAMYANSTRSVDKPDGEELTWRIIHAANPDKTIAVCMVPQDGPMFLRTKGDTSVWNSCEKGQQNIALVARSIIVVPLKVVETVQQKVDRVDKQDGCMKNVACLQQKLTALGVVPVLPPSPPVKNVEPPVEKPKALDMLFVEPPSVELVNLQAENQKLREQIAGTPKSQPFGFVFWSVFALLCGVSALYGGELKRNRVLKTRVEILRASCKKQSGDLEVAGRETRALNLEISALQMRSNELESELAAKEDAASLAKTAAREAPPPRPQLMANVSNLQSVSRLAAKSTKPQSHKTRFTDTGLPKAQLVADIEQKLVAAESVAKAEKDRVTGLRRENDRLREELGVARGKLVEADLLADQSHETLQAMMNENLMLRAVLRLKDEGKTPLEAMFSAALQFVCLAINERGGKPFALSLPVHMRLWNFLQVQAVPGADLIGKFKDQDRPRLEGQQPLLNFMVELDREISASA